MRTRLRREARKSATFWSPVSGRNAGPDEVVADLHVRISLQRLHHLAELAEVVVGTVAGPAKPMPGMTADELGSPLVQSTHLS